MLPKFFYLLVDYPALIAIPIVVFAALAVWSGARSAGLASGAWLFYLGYELGMHGEVLCRGDDCMKRAPLFFVYPLLALLSVVALVQVYVHIRDRRRRRALWRRGHDEIPS